MLQRTFLYTSLLTLLVVLLPSCVSQEVESKQNQNFSSYNVKFSLDLGATELSQPVRAANDENRSILIPTLPQERNITSLYAAIFKEGKFQTLAQLKYYTRGNTAILSLPQKGAYSFVVLANLQNAEQFISSASVSNVQSLYSLVTSQKPSGNDKNDALLMVSPLMEVNIDGQTQVVEPAWKKVKMIRVAARLDVHCTINNMFLTKVTLLNAFTQAQLGDAAMNTPVATDLQRADVPYTFTSADNNKGTQNIVGAIYTYPNTTVGDTYLQIEGVYQDLPFTYKLQVKQNNILRNHIYCLVLTSCSGGFKTPLPLEFAFDFTANEWKPTIINITDIETQP